VTTDGLASNSAVIEREIRIAARPETVFAFFTDPTRMKRWKALSSAAMTTGSTFKATRRSMEFCQAS